MHVLNPNIKKIKKLRNEENEQINSKEINYKSGHS